MENKFLAHIAEDGREQTVFEHLAAEFSRPFGGEAQGLLAGTAMTLENTLLRFSGG